MTMINQVLDEIKCVFLKNELIVTSDHFFSGGKRKTGSRIYIFIHTNKRDLFVKYDQDGKSDIFTKEYQTLEKVESNIFSIPRPIELINKGMVISVVNGISLEPLICRDGLDKSIRVLNEAMILMASFHRKYASQLSKSANQKLFNSMVKNKISSLAQTPMDEINLGFTHGDFDPFNTFFDSSSSKFGLIDWEDFSEFGIQELDALHFIIMTGVIANHGISNHKLYEIIFGGYKQNPYLKLLQTYCRKRPSSIKTVLKLIPVYCDTQNDRLKKNKRDTSDFLYNEFKKRYYSSKPDCCHNNNC
jgi:hypothetical protein